MASTPAYPSITPTRAAIEGRTLIGMSVRADGLVEQREACDSPPVTKIERVHSVDLVTRAGRGGRLLVG